MYQAIVSATLTFMVFTFGALLIAIQVAGGQTTPRIIGSTLLRARVPKYTVALHIFTLILCLSALNKMDQSVHQLVALSIALLGVACFAAFFYLIDYASRTLRPVSVLTHVGDIGVDVIKRVYPELSQGPEVAAEKRPALGPPGRVVLHHGNSAIVLSVDVAAIVGEAERSDSVIEFVPQVGDFVASGEALFLVYAGGQDLNEHVLTTAVMFGAERTTEQDPTFAFRIIVDIALKALSPAINDPTTAVLAIDQLENLLRLTGQRHLRNDAVEDRSGKLRLIFRTPNWEDFVHLTFSEIRAYGSGNLQIARRMRAMIQNLLRALPAHRRKALTDRNESARSRDRESLRLPRGSGPRPCSRHARIGRALDRRNRLGGRGRGRRMSPAEVPTGCDVRLVRARRAVNVTLTASMSNQFRGERQHDRLCTVSRLERAVPPP